MQPAAGERVSPLRRAAAAGLLTGFLGVAALSCWLAGIWPYAASSARIAMVPGAALAFVLAGTSLWLIARGPRAEQPSRTMLWTARACATVVAVLGLLPIVELAAPATAPIAAIRMFLLSALARRAPAPMLDGIAAAGIVLAGGALLLASSERWRRYAQWPALAAALIGALSLTRFIFNDEVTFTHLHFSLSASLGLLLLGAGILLSLIHI